MALSWCATTPQSRPAQKRPALNQVGNGNMSLRTCIMAPISDHGTARGLDV